MPNVPRQQHVQGDSGRRHAPAGVQAGGNLKPHLVAADFALNACPVHHRPEAGTFCVPQLFQAQRSDDPVFPGQGHHVRYRGQGRDFQQAVRFLPDQRPGQLPGHPRAAEEGKRIIPQQGRNHRVRRGQGVPMPVMIRDDHRHAQSPGPSHFCHAGDAAVHRDQNMVFFCQLFHGGKIQPVPFLMPVRDIDPRGYAHGLQRFP